MRRSGRYGEFYEAGLLWLAAAAGDWERAWCPGERWGLAGLPSGGTERRSLAAVAAGDVLGGGGGKGNFKCWSLGIVVYFCLVHYLNGCYGSLWGGCGSIFCRGAVSDVRAL